MANNTNANPTNGAPQISPVDGIRLLKQQIDRANQLLAARPIQANDMNTWELLTSNFLTKAFGEGSPNIRAVTDIGKYGSFPFNPTPEWKENHRADALRAKISRLGGLVELLETDIDLSGDEGTDSKEPELSRRIFLVHGHDDGLLHELARYLEQLDLEPVILREQPSGGRTIIEKFETYSDVGYAVVLLTPDDRGGTAADVYDSQRPRARQNVLFELGYFLGKLTRSRVTALYAEGVEIPSDYSGVAFVALDDRGAWRLELARELKAAGIEVDMNRAL